MQVGAEATVDIGQSDSSKFTTTQSGLRHKPIENPVFTLEAPIMPLLTA